MSGRQLAIYSLHAFRGPSHETEALHPAKGQEAQRIAGEGNLQEQRREQMSHVR